MYDCGHLALTVWAWAARRAIRGGYSPTDILRLNIQSSFNTGRLGDYGDNLAKGNTSKFHHSVSGRHWTILITYCCLWSMIDV